MFADELRRLFRRPRSIVILVIVAVVPIALGVIAKTLGAGGSGGPPFFSQLTQNPIFLSLVALTTMQPFVLPLMVSLVAGDAIAGEASSGALRYLLVAPASRVKIVLIKTASALIFAIVIALVVALAGGLAGALLFHAGKIITLSGTEVSQARGILLTFEASLVVGVSLFSVVGVGIFVSTLTDSPSAASAITVGVAIASEILGGVPQLVHIQPILLSNYWQSFIDLFRDPQILHNVGRNLIEQGGWLVASIVAALVNFTQRDITS